jgi:hypothetical protein
MSNKMDTQSFIWEMETNKDSEIYSKGELSPFNNMSFSVNNNKVKKRKRELIQNFCCEYSNCNKTYSQRYRLEIHKRTHVNFIFYF